MSQIIGKFVSVKVGLFKGRQGIIVGEGQQGIWLAIEGEDVLFFFYDEIHWP